ncbi:hypothetical protein PR202_ga20026 [Eleusine coracana subsp. coracana]|uniref:DUF6598 domain-containing protein n=1 Tax=Eleusine coracana subsp. coracana TaxID=191504 RepID=A0AAV5CVP9_ELECO|nr:hypothetical protein PR202_ga20026 [Eleusine coracana subsp. coracana]
MDLAPSAGKLKHVLKHRKRLEQIEAIDMKEAVERMSIEKREEAVERGAIEKKEAATEKRGEGMKKTEEGMKKREAAKKRYKGKGKTAVFMTKEEKLKLELANYLEWKKKKEADRCDPMSEQVRDPYAFEARSFKQRWEEIYGKMGYGNFGDITSRFMSDSGAKIRESWQVYSVKVSELTGGLQWPLDVYGLVANPYLVLTGPMRAVVLCDCVVFEVSLYVRGTADSDDKELSLLAVSCKSDPCPSHSFLTTRSYTSRLSTLDFKLGHIVYSVEATINVKVISGPPHGFYGEFVAFTDKIEDGVVLHKSGDKELHLAGDKVNLSRSVVSVGSGGKLKISVMAWDGCVNSMGSLDFRPLKKGRSSGEIEVAGLCKLEVNVD